MPVKNENKIKNDEHASSLNSKCERQAKRQACAFFFFFIFWILCEEHQAKGHAGALSPSLPLTWVHASSRSSMPVAGKLFLSQRALSDFLRVLADIVVGKVGTDLVLRNSLQQVCGEKNFTLGLLRDVLLRLARLLCLSLPSSTLCCLASVFSARLWYRFLVLGIPLLSSLSFLLPWPFLSTLPPVLLLTKLNKILKCCYAKLKIFAARVPSSSKSTIQVTGEGARLTRSFLSMLAVCVSRRCHVSVRRCFLMLCWCAMRLQWNSGMRL